MPIFCLLLLSSIVTLWGQGFDLKSSIEKADAGDLDAQQKIAAHFLEKDIRHPYVDKYLQLAAEQGNVTSQYVLGVRYLSGDGGETNAVKAAHWLKKASEKGHAGADFNLGMMYFRGRGVPKDHASAYQCFKRADEKGQITGASLELAFCYRAGYGTAIDLEKAAGIYLRLANKGVVRAQEEIGTMYVKGEGVQKNLIEAYKWINLAAIKENKDMLLLRSELEQVLSKEEIAEAQKRSREFKIGDASQGER